MNYCLNTNEKMDGDTQQTSISILMPLYNGIEFLETSLESVIKQTYTNWQLIIGINGHPKDSPVMLETKFIVDKLDENHSCDILVKHYNTVGKPNTLNAMIPDSKFDWIALLDVDDYWSHDKLELQVQYLDTYDVVGTNTQYFGDKKGCPGIPLGDITTSHNIFRHNPIINSSVVIRKSDAVWEDVFLDDYNMWFNLYLLNRKFYNINKILCYHRIHKKSAFNNTNNMHVDKLRKVWQTRFKLAKKS